MNERFGFAALYDLVEWIDEYAEKNGELSAAAKEFQKEMREAADRQLRESIL